MQGNYGDVAMRGKYGDLIKKTRELEVDLCVKAPISLRRHWSAEAKRTGVTMTAMIVEALKDRFGEPD